MSSSYVKYIIDLLSSLGNIRVKSMFGGYGVYKDNVIIGMIVDSELYFKVDESNKSQYEAVGSAPFCYQSRGVTYKSRGKEYVMSYWQVPIDIIEDKEKLSSWIEQSYNISLLQKQQKCKKHKLK